MKKQSLLWLKSIFAAIALILALVRWLFFGLVSQRMDSVFFLLIATAFFIFILPWERLSSFKAVGIEISLDKPEVKAALASLDLKQVEDEELGEKLAGMSSEIEQANGGRILWIDDKPYKLYSEKRLLRALGIQIITVTSSEEAEGILGKDNDFDIIITDAKRADDDYAGAKFIIRLRTVFQDPVIRSLPVIFYARYEWNSLVVVTRPARELLPEAQLSNTPKALIVKTLQTLAEARSRPIKSKSFKGGSEATDR